MRPIPGIIEARDAKEGRSVVAQACSIDHFCSVSLACYLRDNMAGSLTLCRPAP